MGFLKGIKAYSRRKFLLTGTLAIGSVAVVRKFWLHKSRNKATVKFLTQDGQVVEVNKKHLPGKSKSVTKDQLVKWIWKDQQF